MSTAHFDRRWGTSQWEAFLAARGMTQATVDRMAARERLALTRVYLREIGATSEATAGRMILRAYAEKAQELRTCARYECERPANGASAFCRECEEKFQIYRRMEERDKRWRAVAWVMIGVAVGVMMFEAGTAPAGFWSGFWRGLMP